MLEFKDWLLNEGFELPYRVIKDIYEFYRDSYEKYRINSRVKIEPKYFDLDLTGTRYEFVNDLNPRVLVEPAKNLPQNTAGWCSHPTITTENGVKRVNFVIKLGLKHFADFLSAGMGIVDHEVLHAVQALIKIKKEMKVIGGLPNMPLVKRLSKEKDIHISGFKNKKRVKHAVRPVEYYTNLDTLIKELQGTYVNMLKASGRDIESGVRDTEAKKEYFNKLKKEESWIIRRLNNVKFDEELYKIYLQQVTKRFILNNDFLPNIMPFIRDLEKYKKENEDEWKIAAEKKGISVEELKKQVEDSWRSHREYKQREEARKKEEKEKEKAEKKLKEKENRDRLIEHIRNFNNYLVDDLRVFKNYKYNHDKKLSDFIKSFTFDQFPKWVQYSRDGNSLCPYGMRWYASEVLDNIRKKIYYYYNLQATTPDVSPLYIMFGYLKKYKLKSPEDFAKFHDDFAEKLAEVISNGLELGFRGKKLILDNFYNVPASSKRGVRIFNNLQFS